MIWVAIIVLAGLAFALAAFALRLSRAGWTLFAAALLFGLAGYAFQGSSELPGNPVSAVRPASDSGAQMVAARRQFFDDEKLPSNWIVTADGFARRGDYQRAAGFYSLATQNDPRDQEGWVALGMALVEHADGTLTPAARYAFERGREVAPGNGAAQYFLGVASLQVGDAAAARDYWADALAQAPANADWREAVMLQQRLLEQSIRQAPPMR